MSPRVTRARRATMANLINTHIKSRSPSKRGTKRAAPTTELGLASTDGQEVEPPVKRKRTRPRKNLLSGSAPLPRVLGPAASFAISSVDDDPVTWRSKQDPNQAHASIAVVAGVLLDPCPPDRFLVCATEETSDDSETLTQVRNHNVLSSDPTITLPPRPRISLSSLTIPLEVRQAFGLEEQDRPRIEDDSRETYRYVARNLSYKLRKVLRYAEDEGWPSDIYYFGWCPDEVYKEYSDPAEFMGEGYSVDE